MASCRYKACHSSAAKQCRENFYRCDAGVLRGQRGALHGARGKASSRQRGRRGGREIDAARAHRGGT